MVYRRGYLGLDLRIARVAAGLLQADVARELGVTPRRISNLEATIHVRPETAARVLGAIERAGRR